MPPTESRRDVPAALDPGAQFAVGTLATAVLRLAGRLEDAARTLHAGDDLSVAERSFLLHLRQGGQQTIPELAIRRGATRQYVQQALAPLTARGLVEWRENPRHRRSRLAALTPAGAELARRLMAREGALMRELASVAERPALAGAATTLAALEAALTGALATALAQAEAGGGGATEKAAAKAEG